MKTKKVAIWGLIIILSLMLMPKSSKASNQNQADRPQINVTEKEGCIFDSFSAEQRQLYGSLVGEFVLNCFRGQETLNLPETITSYCVENEEMAFVIRRQQYLIDAICVLGGGQICNLSHQETSLWDIQKLSDDRVQVTAYVKLSFYYADDPEQHQSGMGLKVVATLVKNNEEHYFIENYNDDSEFQTMKTDYQTFCLRAEQKGNNDRNKLMDLYFDERLSQLRTAKELEKDIYEKRENKNEEEAIDVIGQSSEDPSRLSVSYDGTAAATYAQNEGPQYERIFYRVIQGGDCTNFVSQAMWVGYGGDIGDYANWLSNPSTTYLNNCKLWAWLGYRMIPGTTGWNGASKYASSSYLPSGPWMRVWQLWSYLSTSSSGPRANKYNDGLLYSACSLTIQKGDILQFSSDPSKGYTHSVMVVNNSGQSLSVHAYIYVAQHSGDYGWRQLSSVIANNGPYVRIIRPIAGNFVE